MVIYGQVICSSAVRRRQRRWSMMMCTAHGFSSVGLKIEDLHFFFSRFLATLEFLENTPPMDTTFLSAIRQRWKRALLANQPVQTPVRNVCN